MTLQELQERTRTMRCVLERCWDHETRNPGDYPSHAPVSAGQCAVTALLVQAELGGELLSGTVNGQSHWYNWVPVEDSTGKTYLSCVDLTGDQFGQDLVCYGTGPSSVRLHSYPRLRNWEQVNADTRQRMHLLRKRYAAAQVTNG